tara:strand:+ start:16152 stop:17045 length:894 start_codon:yes stop_codon:yes gene_type:complete
MFKKLFLTITIFFVLGLTIQATQGKVPLKFYDFEGKEKVLSFENLIKISGVKEVTVMNPATLSIENYKAINLRTIFNVLYPNKSWQKGFGIKVLTKDKYEPLVEMYKFKEREPFLAYERVDGKPFKSYAKDKKKLVNLGPYYLVWIEDYKNKNAARRRHHWPYQVVSFSLEKNPPVKLIPNKDKNSSEYWGYKNYIKQCFMCHQAYGIGGESNGEIISNGLTKKYSDKKLALYIGNPTSVIKDSKMAEFPLRIDLRIKRIKDIVAYLRYLEKNNPHKVKTKRKYKAQEIDELLEELN